MKSTASKILRQGSSFLFRSREGGWWFAGLVALVWGAVLLFGEFHHEFWRDETPPWVLARDAAGFWDIVTGDRVYDGHPPLWYWYLRGWTLVSRNVNLLHLATFVAEGTAGLLLLRYAPFPRLIKVALLFSYLFGYEYGIMSRNYTIGVTAAFAFAATYRPFRTRWTSFVCLALLALSSIYGLILSFCLAALLVIHRARAHVSDANPAAVSFEIQRRAVVGCGALLCVFVFTYLATNPPDPNPYSPGWNFAALDSSAVVPTFQRMMAAFFPLRKPDDIHFWVGGSQYVALYPSLFEHATKALPIVLLLALLPAWPEILILASGTVLISVVQIARYMGHIRHWGHFLILFIVVDWVRRLERPRARNWVSNLLLALVGICQVQGFWVATKQDRKHAFSGGQETAQAIQKAGLQNLPLIIGPDWDAVAVTSYLDRTFISSETDETNQTIVFHGRRRGFSVEGLVQKAAEVAREKKSQVLVISNRGLPAPKDVGSFALFFHTTKSPLMGDEDFWVYKLTP